MFSLSTHWSLPAGPPLQWRRWDDEAVVFNPFSGDTHLLNLVERTALEQIQEAGRLTLDALVTRLAERLQLDDTTDLEAYLLKLLAQFSEVGLIVSDHP